jgi:hypothetical protein
MIDIDGAIARVRAKDQERIAHAEDRARKMAERRKEMAELRERGLRWRLERLNRRISGEAPPAALHHWLRHDTWGPYQALAILAGCDPEHLRFSEAGEIIEHEYRSRFSGYVLLNGLDLNDEDLLDALGERVPSRLHFDFREMYGLYRKLWHSGKDPQTRHPPSFFIDWAIAKGLPPVWLQWARDEGYVADKSSEVKEVSGKSETAYLHLIGALCDLYWREKHPDAKKINQSNLIAELVDKYQGFSGMSERNLKEKLSAAIQRVRPQ